MLKFGEADQLFVRDVHIISEERVFCGYDSAHYTVIRLIFARSTAALNCENIQRHVRNGEAKLNVR